MLILLFSNGPDHFKTNQSFMAKCIQRPFCYKPISCDVIYNIKRDVNYLLKHKSIHMGFGFILIIEIITLVVCYILFQSNVITKWFKKRHKEKTAIKYFRVSPSRQYLGIQITSPYGLKHCRDSLSKTNQLLNTVLSK